MRILKKLFVDLKIPIKSLNIYRNNFSWILFDNVLRLFLGVFVSILLARKLGPSSFGIYNYSITIVGFFTSISCLGIDSIVVKELVKHEDKRSILFNSFLIKLFGGLIAYLFFSFIIILEESELAKKVLILLGLTLLVQPFSIFDFFFQSKLKNKYSVISTSISRLFISILKILALVCFPSLVLFAGLVLFESLITIILLWMFFKKDYYFEFNKTLFNKELFFKILTKGFPLILVGLFHTINVRIDQIIIRNFLNFDELGFYSTAVKVTELFNFLPVVIMTAVFPSLVGTKNYDLKLYYKRMKVLFLILFSTAVFVSIIIVISSDFLITFMYGEAYVESIKYLKYLIWSSVFIFLGVYMHNLLINHDLQTISLYSNIIGAIINIYLNFRLIPTFGVIGAVYSTLISYLFSGFISFLFFKKSLKILKKILI